VAGLDTIEGIGDVLAGKLKTAGIETTDALLENGATPGGRDAIVTKTGIEAGRILKFVNHADLMRIKGVGGEYAELLEAAGVDSVPELARRNAANLQRLMTEVNEARKFVRQVPADSSVVRWIDEAKTLAAVVKH
jgi:predicted flap endonuclease-1-like 5' DNA nuclease